MSETMKAGRGCAGVLRLPLLLLMLSMAGCASVTEDVDKYYRQMEYNYKEAQDRAEKQTASLQRQSSVLAASGDVRKAQKTQKEIERIKAWEAKMAKEEKRFQKAAEWTEKHFHLEKPAIDGEPISARPPDEGVSLQPSEIKNP
jgi:ATPase subunit of ABC transporter with duplicated ATPase domains